jgi:hypothetical protein
MLEMPHIILIKAAPRSQRSAYHTTSQRLFRVLFLASPRYVDSFLGQFGLIPPSTAILILELMLRQRTGLLFGWLPIVPLYRMMVSQQTRL